MFFRIIEQLFVIVLFLASMHVVSVLANPSIGRQDYSVSSAELDMSGVAIEAGLYTWGAVLVLMRWRRVLKAAITVWPLVGLTTLASLSTLWSVQPVLTLRRGALLQSSTVIAIYLGERYSVEDLARLLANTLCLLMVLALIFYFIAPAYVIDYYLHPGAWTGLTGFKNAFGEYMGVAVTLLLLIRFRQLRWLRYVFLATAAVLLVLSHSANALVCCVLMVAAMPLWSLTRSNGERRLLVFAMTALLFFTGIVFVSGHTGPLFRMLGRDSTLTGRTHLWSMLLPAIAAHPILGYGYGAFWTGLKGEVLEVWIRAGWLAPLADNGYLDLCLSLGLLGTCVFLYVFVQSFRKAIGYVRSEPGPIGLWPVTFMCFFALHSVFESTLLSTGGLSFLVFAATATSLAVDRKRVATASRTIGMSLHHSMMRDWTSPTLSQLAPGSVRVTDL